MDVSRLPPKAKMGTSIPVFPNGRVGMVCTPSEASVKGLIAEKTAPTLAAPTVFKKFLRDRLCFFINMQDSPFLIEVLIFDLLK